MKSSYSSMGNSPAPWTTRRVILGTLAALSVVIGFLLFYRFRLVIVIIFSGIAVSMAMAPAIDWLYRHHVPRSLSVILIYLALLVLMITFILLLVPPIIEQLTAAVPKIEAYYLMLKPFLMTSPLLVVRQIAALLPSSVDLSLAVPPTVGGSLDTVGQAFNTTGAILSGLFTLLSILLIGFYWTLEEETVVRSFTRSLSIDRRDSTHEMLSEISQRVGGYLRGQLILAVTIGLADLVVYLIIGLPAALAVSLLAGLFEMIPVIGPTLGAIPALLVAFAYDPAKALWVIAAGALIQFLENNILAPRVMRKTVGINPIVTLLAIVAFGALFGFAGLLLAIPMAAMIQIILERSLLRPQASGLEMPQGRDRLSKLRFDAQEFVVDIRNLARHKVTGSVLSERDPIEDSLEEIAMELDHVLAQESLPGDSA